MRELYAATLAIFIISAFSAGCGTDVVTAGPDASVGTDQAGAVDVGGGKDEAGAPLQGDGALAATDGAAPPPTTGASCPRVGERLCSGAHAVRVCTPSGGGQAWVVSGCSGGKVCVNGLCAAGCADACDLDATRTTGGNQQTCKLVDASSGKTISAGSNRHDKARRYNAWLRRHNLAHGYVTSAYFSSTKLTSFDKYGGTGDCALWSGTYLAAEALRLMATGAPDAEDNVQKMVERMHRLFEINGHPGYLSRFAAPLDQSKYKALYKPADPGHHTVKYAGKDYFWAGSTSRDQYQGAILGYALAYEATSSAKHKQIIRDDMVAVATELLKLRTNVKFKVKIMGATLPLTATNFRYVIFNPAEFKDGAVSVEVGSGGGGVDVEKTTLRGMREFFPNYAVLAKQFPLLGGLVPKTIPRASSTLMLMSILQTAMLTTRGVPGYEKHYNSIRAHYYQNVGAWLKHVGTYFYQYAKQCWKSYYGINIAHMPLYNLMRLEGDPKVQAALRQVLTGKIRPVVSGHKNVFFDYIYAVNAKAGAVDKPTADAASGQLKKFRAPPFADASFDISSKYPKSGCADMSSKAVDLDHRPGSHFVWQRNPFVVKYKGNAKRVYPGVGYLTAYWMGRAHGLLGDETAGACLQWK